MLKNKLNELTETVAKEQEKSKHLEEDKQRLLKEVASNKEQLNEYKQETQRVGVYIYFIRIKL